MAPHLEGRYRVVADVTTTPEAFVYVAEDLVHERPVSLLVLRPELAEDAEFATAVQEQAQLLAKPECAHPAIARTYECGLTDEGDVFIATEPVSGRLLRDVLYERGAHDAPAALRLAIQIGEALETLHHGGVVHGELRPDCVMVVKGDDGIEAVKLMGIEFTRARRTRRGVRLRDATLRAYLAPEQITGTDVTEATDVHALGLLLGELLTGDPPRGLARQRRPPRGIPRPIARILSKALEPRAARRYADASLMVNALWTAEGGLQKTVRAPVPSPSPETRTTPKLAWMSRVNTRQAVAAVVGVVLLGVGAWVASDRLASLHPQVAEEPSAAPPVVPVAPVHTTGTPVAPPSAAPSPVVDTAKLPVAEASRAAKPAPAAVVDVPQSPKSPSATTEASQAPKLPGAAAEASQASRPPAAAAEVPQAAKLRPAAAEAPQPKIEPPVVSSRVPPASPARAVAKGEATPPARRGSAPGTEPRPADGDGAAIIDWLLKGRP